MYSRRKGRRKEEREAERGGKGMGKMEDDYIREKKKNHYRSHRHYSHLKSKHSVSLGIFSDLIIFREL